MANGVRLFPAGCIIVSLLTSAATLAESPAAVGEIVAGPTVEFGGVADASAVAGALRASPATSEEFASLTGETVSVSLTVQRGIQVRGADGSTLLETHEGADRSHERLTLTNASVEFAAGDGQPVILAYTTNGSAVMTTRATGSTIARSVENEVLAWTGAHDQTQSVGEAKPGYTYRVPGPWPGLFGADEGAAKGAFEVFVNNVTVSVAGDEGTWTSWAGFRRDDSKETVTEYELRILTLVVQDGRITVSAPNRVDLVGPGPQVVVNGVLSAPVASGDLSSDAGVYRWNEVPLALEGRGRVAIDAKGGDPVISTQPAGSDARSRLGLRVSGAFGVEDAALVQFEPAVRAGRGSGLAWGVLAGVLVLGVGTLVVTRVDPVRSRLDVWRGRRGRHRYERWTMAAGALMRGSERERALKAWRRVVARYPHRGEDWFELGLVAFELGEYEAALEAFERTDELAEGSDHDVWHMLARAHIRLGQREDAISVLEELAVIDPHGFLVLVEQECDAVLREDPRVASLIVSAERAVRSKDPMYS